MNQTLHKRLSESRRKFRIRSKISGTAERPRLSVSVSNKHISAQLIDDTTRHTIVAATTIGQTSKAKGTMTEKATLIGETIAKKAKKAGVKKVVFDRNGKMYHGRVKALADAARKEGLEF